MLFLCNITCILERYRQQLFTWKKPTNITFRAIFPSEICRQKRINMPE